MKDPFRNKISGYTCIWKGVELDYCFHLTILSLLKVCDEVVVGYRKSDDGTLGILETLAGIDSRVRIITQEPEVPNGDLKWWTRWVNQTRAHLRYPVQMMLDADEVLDDSFNCLTMVRAVSEAGRTAEFHRLNFVKDAYHLIPDGHCCGHKVTRLAPSHYWMPSDEPYAPQDLPEIHRQFKVSDPRLRVFHYGFLRRTAEFYKKCDGLFTIHFGERDSRLDEVRAEQADDWYRAVGWGNMLVPWSGKHPDMATEWLKERKRL